MAPFSVPPPDTYREWTQFWGYLDLPLAVDVVEHTACFIPEFRGLTNPARLTLASLGRQLKSWWWGVQYDRQHVGPRATVPEYSTWSEDWRLAHSNYEAPRGIRVVPCSFGYWKTLEQAMPGLARWKIQYRSFGLQHPIFSGCAWDEVDAVNAVMHAAQLYEFQHDCGALTEDEWAVLCLLKSKIIWAFQTAGGFWRPDPVSVREQLKKSKYGLLYLVRSSITLTVAPIARLSQSSPHGIIRFLSGCTSRLALDIFYRCCDSQSVAESISCLSWVALL